MAATIQSSEQGRHTRKEHNKATMWAKNPRILPWPLTEPENIFLKAPSTLFSRGRLSAWGVWLKVVKDLKVGHGSNRNENARTEGKRGPKESEGSMLAGCTIFIGG